MQGLIKKIEKLFRNSKSKVILTYYIVIIELFRIE
jgi:hypothetical protein